MAKWLAALLFTLLPVASGAQLLRNFVLNDGNIVFQGQVNPDLDSIVVVHGWQIPLLTSSYSQNVAGLTIYMDNNGAAGDFALKNIVGAIQKRSAIRQFDVNVFVYQWEGAHQVNLVDTFIHSTAAGKELARQLDQKLNTAAGGTYKGAIHTIGHSAGTVVNAAAIYQGAIVDDTLDFTQNTTLDIPADLTGVAVNDFLSFMPTGSVRYVDNYYGTDKISPLPAVGEPIPGAGLNVQIGGLGVLLDANHVEVHSKYYSPLVETGQPQSGYRVEGTPDDWLSPAMGPNSLDSLSVWSRAPAIFCWRHRPSLPAGHCVLTVTYV